MPPILFEIKNDIAHISLNRPERLNSFNREMALLLQQRLDEANSDSSVRCVVITGSGKAFCAGQDLLEVADPHGPGMEKILVEHFNPVIMKIRNLAKPVVAFVNGVAAGAGANIALCCDIVIAATSASFIQAFSKIGLVPDSSGTYFLPRLIGFQKASALMMLGEKVTALEAEQMGMAYKVFPDDTFEQEALKIAETLATMPTRGLALIKTALNKSFTQTLEEQLSTEDDLQQQAASTNDFKEGVRAFIEKRRPEFSGN